MISKNQEDNIYETLDSCTLCPIVANQSNPIILPPMVIHTCWIGNLLKVGLCLGEKYASNFVFQNKNLRDKTSLGQTLVGREGKQFFFF